MEARKLISKFLTNLCEKNYSKANKNLEEVIAHKTKKRISEATKKAKGNSAEKAKNEKAEKTEKKSKKETKKG